MTKANFFEKKHLIFLLIHSSSVVTLIQYIDFFVRTC